MHLKYIDCGIHAREWVSPSSCVFMIARVINFTPINYSLQLKIY